MFDARTKARAAELLRPEYLPPSFLSYVADYVTLNQPPLTSGQIVGASRYNWTIDSDGSVLEVVSSAADTTIYTYTLGGGTLGTQGGLRLLMMGDYLNNSGAGRTYMLTVSFGATTMYNDTSGSLTASANRRPLIMDLYLTAAGATNAQELTGIIGLGSLSGAATGIGDLAAQADRLVIGGTAAEDSTVNKALTVKWQHSASNANLSVRIKYAVLTKIGH